MAVDSLSPSSKPSRRITSFNSSGLGFSDPLVLKARETNQKKEKKVKRLREENEQRKTLFSEKLGRDIAENVLRDDARNLSLVDRIYYATTSTTGRTTSPDSEKGPATIFTGEELDIITYGSVSASEISLLPLLQSSRNQEAEATEKAKGKNHPTTSFSLTDLNTLSIIQDLFAQYCNITHTTFLHAHDASYKFFLAKDRNAAVYYKMHNHTAIILGDPLCAPELFDQTVTEFSKSEGIKEIVFLGASETLLNEIPEEKIKNWMAVGIAQERVVNPMTNPVLLGQKRKSISKRNRFLLDPRRGGLKIGLYTPRKARDMNVEQQLRLVYTKSRVQMQQSQQSISDPDTPIFLKSLGVSDPFTLPHLTSYIYVLDTYTNSIIGFATLLPVGAKNGYHLSHPIIDPTPTIPKGLSDLLIYSTLSLLKCCKTSHLSLSYEILPSLGTMKNMPSFLESFTRRAVGGDGQRCEGYRRYVEKFRPDPSLGDELYVLLPMRLGPVRDVLHFGGSCCRGVLWRWVVGMRRKGRERRMKREMENDWDAPVALGARRRMALI